MIGVTTMIESHRRPARRSARWLSASALVLAAPALAQTASSPGTPTAAADVGTGLEEITVTAQKRTESLQSVPISILAFNTKKLDQLQVSSFADYSRFVPSLSYQTNGPGTNRPYFRGVTSGGDGNHSGSQPSVSTYLDEQPITTILGAVDIHIYDIARVEALAGPQGTLYGASSQAGVLRIITNKPEIGKFSAGYNVGANTTAHGKPGYVIEGFVNAPVADNAAVRLVGWYEHDGGYIDNVQGTRTYPVSGITIDNKDVARDNYNWNDTYGARAALKVDLSDNWSITPQLMAQVQKSEGVFAYDPTKAEPLQVTHFKPEDYQDKWLQASLLIEGKVGNFDLTYAGSYLSRQINSNSDYTDYTFFYDPYYGGSIVDNNGAFINPSQRVVGTDNFNKQSHELRIASDKANRFRFVGGLFFQIQNHHIVQEYIVDGLATSSSINGRPGTIWLTNQQRTDKDYAAFGEASFDILPTLTATVGGRYYKFDNSLYGYYGLVSGQKRCIPNATRFVPGSPIVNGVPCTRLDKSVSDTGFLPKLNLTWNFSPDGLVYATYSKGYRPGGVNRNGNLLPYDSDFLRNFEIGWKTSWLDNRLRFNGAIFYQKWDNFQLSFLGQNSLTVVQNVGNANIKGIEADFSFVPVNGLTLSGSASYIDAKTVGDFCPHTDSTSGVCLPGDVIVIPDGSRLPVTPDFKASGVARYEFPVGHDFDAHIQGVVSYQSSFWNGLKQNLNKGFDGVGPTGRVVPSDRDILGKSPGFAQVDFAAGIARGNWSFEFWGKNLFDVLGDRSRYAECTTAICGGNALGTQINGVTAPGIVYRNPITPRTIGVSFSQKF